MYNEYMMTRSFLFLIVKLHSTHHQNHIFPSTEGYRAIAQSSWYEYLGRLQEKINTL